ncbi:MAG: SurA N-terminal domain-containing protein [Limnochordales bacterium]|nr:hypothetical protein [Bacillota bacterium]
MFFSTLRKHMRWIIIVVVVAFVAGTLYVGVNFGQQATEAAAPVAEVNGRAISYAEFQQVYFNNVQLYSQYFGPVRGTMAEELRYLSLSSLIDSYLTLEAARAANLPVSNREIDETLAEIKASFADDAAYRQALAASGLTEARLRELIRDDVMVRKFQEQVRRAEFTDEEVRAAMAEVRVRHILVKPADAASEASWEEARSRAEALRAELLNGASFEEYASTYSADLASAIAGGDVGWVSFSTPFVEEFKEAALALQAGEISQPVRTVYGWHIIQATERREPTDEEFAERREEMLAALQQAAGDRQWSEWISARRNQAQVVIHDRQLLAHHQARNGELEAAVRSYQEAILEDPFNPYLHVSLAEVYERLGRMEDAVREYEQAVAKAETDPDLHLQLGLAYREVGRDEDAAASFRKAGEINPWDAQLQVSLLQLFREMGLEEDVAVVSQRLADIQKAWQEQQRALSGETSEGGTSDVTGDAGADGQPASGDAAGDGTGGAAAGSDSGDNAAGGNGQD